MPKYSGIKPPAQPRSLRTIAETNTGEFTDDADVQPTGEYTDDAEAARPVKDRGVSSADKQPFANLKGGR